MAYRARLCLLAMILLGGTAASAFGHAPPSPFERGVAAYKRGAYEKARTLLRSVFERRPAQVHERWGAVAYWLGRAYEACSQPDSARWAWRNGVQALEDSNRFDAPLYDAHLWAQWAHAEDRAAAVDTYLSLLSRAGSDLDARDRPVLRRHVAQLLPVLPESRQDRVLRASASAADSLRVRAGAGAWLAAWWRGRDPLPATAANERVEEHLMRVRHATEAFPDDQDPAGFDDRGDLYVRYGPPADTHSIPFMDLGFLREVVHLGVGVSLSDFPDNVIWKYPQVGERGQYLFVEKDGRYRLGTAMDLFPSKLTRHYNASDRSQSRAYSSLAAMRYIYEHLAMHYRDPGNVYPTVVRYFNVQRAQEKSVLQRGATEIGRGAGARRVYRAPGIPTPSEVANQNLRTAEQRERMFVEKRAQEMPAAHSTAASPEATLPVQVRLVRSLAADGSTRVDVLWGGPLASNALDAPQRVTASLVSYDRAYVRREETTTHHRISESPQRGQVPYRAQVATVSAPGRLYHLGMQWDRYAVEEPGGDVRLGEQTGQKALRFDSLRALRARPGRLEMSDLRPMILPKAPTDVAGRLVEAARPYPFRAVSAGTPLLLGFEVYHLAYGANDRTRYTVEYELVRRTERNGLFGFLRGDDETRTATASTYAGSERRTAEYILLEWRRDPPDEPQPVTVTVRVTDETTGQTVERSIDFRLLPPEASVARAATAGAPPQ